MLFRSCTDIAKAAGLSPSVVLETVQEDNLERQEQFLQRTDLLFEEEGEDLDNEQLQFPLSEEEIDSDFMESDQD